MLRNLNECNLYLSYRDIQIAQGAFEELMKVLFLYLI
jgi:hypothetical protein